MTRIVKLAVPFLLLIIFAISGSSAGPVGSNFRLDSSPADPAFQEAVARLVEGRTGAADEAFKRILQSNPKHVYALLGRANIALKEDRVAEAEKLVGEAMAINANAPEAHNMLGMVRVRQNRQSEAVAEFKKAIALEPRFFTPRLHLAAIYRAQKQNTLAVEEYQAVIKVAPSLNLGYLELADYYLAAGSTKDAMAVLQKWKDTDPANPEAPNAMGLAYASQKQYDKALGEFDAALKISPKFTQATKNKADAYALKGDVKAAVEAYEATIRTNPKYLEAYVRLGLLYHQNNDRGKAIETFRRAIAVDPSYPLAYNDLAWILAQEGKELDEALKLAQTAVKLAPRYADAQDTLGFVYFRMARYDDAIRVLGTAKSLRPNHAETLAFLGMAYYEKGMRQEALPNLTAALELNPMLGDAPKIRKMMAEIRAQKRASGS